MGGNDGREDGAEWMTAGDAATLLDVDKSGLEMRAN
jgi:hypothetical protein